MAGKVEILGEAELQRQLTEIGQEIELSGKAGKDAAVLVARVAAGVGRNLSGRLGGSYRGLGSKKSGRVVSKLPYAAPLEYGWPARNIAAQERVMRAMRQSSGQVLAIYERYCRDKIAAKGGGGSR